MKKTNISALTRVEGFMMLDVPVQTFIDEDGQVVFNADDVEKALGIRAGEMQEILQHINS